MTIANLKAFALRYIRVFLEVAVQRRFVGICNFTAFNMAFKRSLTSMEHLVAIKVALARQNSVAPVPVTLEDLLGRGGVLALDVRAEIALVPEVCPTARPGALERSCTSVRLLVVVQVA